MRGKISLKYPYASSSIYDFAESVYASERFRRKAGRLVYCGVLRTFPAAMVNTIEPVVFP
jgi:hypothetical protein